jgi:hypothetical protein
MCKELEEKLKQIPEDSECPIELIKEYKDALKNGSIDESSIPVFSSRYPTLMKMIIECQDLNLLDLFLEKLSEIQSGNNELKAVENELAHILNDKYVVPKLKEKK